ncbi:LysE family translocator [Bacillus taeanensis]|uniref:LysE family translocator n=1 Tax=Bacillus taeanensis TaxID=273032 RepID=A0A366Y2A0_9BACI|nr:LysE family translocator [Bacillus taeanensis]RBW71119.1 LysE family translocator [Bacillus taeanensis]
MINFHLFVFMCILLILLPGPDTAVATKNTLTSGRIGGFKTMTGTCSALFIHTLAAVVGLSAIIVKSALLFSIFKYVGAVYLMYLGFKALWTIKQNKKTPAVHSDSVSTSNNKSCFKQGFFTNLLNPKVAVFFLTFLPQFVESGEDAFLPFLTMGMTYTLLTALWFLLYITLINQISAFMKRPLTQKVIEGITAFVLIGFGLKLALEKVHHTN